MRGRSFLAFSFWTSSLMLLTLGGMKASPVSYKEDITTTTDTTITMTSFISPSMLCGPNSNFEYGTVCPRSCDNLYYIYHTLCIALAVEGCFCDYGYVLQSDSSKQCIPETTCAISCADNMHYQTGASYCQANCHYPIIPENCDGTYDGCVCDDGYIINYRLPYNASNVCVRESECWNK